MTPAAILLVVARQIGPPAHCVVIEAPATVHDCLAREVTPPGYEASEWRRRRVGR